MCWPVVLLAASLALTAAAGAQQASAARAAGKYNNAVAQENQKVANAQSQDALNRGALAENENRIRTRVAMGQQTASLAANNVELSTGTPADILGDTALFGAVDERRIRTNAAREAWGYQVQGMNYGAQGALDKFSGNSQALGTYLTTASNLTSSGYSAYRSGGFSGSTPFAGARAYGSGRG